MADWKQVYLLSPVPCELKSEFYSGKLVYRKRDSNKRIGYSMLKKGLVKKDIIIKFEIPILPF